MKSPTIANLLAKHHAPEVAKAIGVDRKTAYRWKVGTCVPSSQYVAPLAKHLRVGVDVVLAAVAVRRVA